MAFKGVYMYKNKYTFPHFTICKVTNFYPNGQTFESNPKANDNKLEGCF